MRRALIIIVALTLVTVAGSMAYFIQSSRQAGRVEVAKIFTAAQAYTADLRVRGLPVPKGTTLEELIQRRLLNANDLRGFAGMSVSINLAADPRNPQEVLLRAPLEDGREMVVLADGSVQQTAAGKHPR